MGLLTFISKEGKFNYFSQKQNKNNTNIRKQAAPHESI